MKSLNLGLIGCGRIAQAVHLSALLRLPGVTLTALADPAPEQLQLAARRAPAAAAYADYHDLLAQAGLDGVIICAPTPQHAQVAGAAFAAGQHVFLEKPLAADLAEGRVLLAAWRASGRVGMIGFNYRYNALMQQARDHLRAGRLGPLVGGTAVFLSEPGPLPDWKKSRATGGGVLLDLGSHVVDLARFLFEAEVNAVQARLMSRHSEADTATLELALTNGLTLQALCGLGAGHSHRLEIFGQAARLTVDRAAGYLSLTPARPEGALGPAWNLLRSVVRSPYFLARLRRADAEPSYFAALTVFAAAVRGAAAAAPDLQEGYRSLAVIAAAEESARSGQRRILSPADENPAG